METTKYWKGLEELHNEDSYRELKEKEFPEEVPVMDIVSDTLTKKTAGRRDFLKLMGFSVTAAAVAASCRIPVRKAIPYVIKPEEIVPGVANYYASTYSDGAEYCAVLVKTRDGRPIKIEGNTFSNVTKGGTSARVQASVLSLYDKHREISAHKNKADITWDALDGEVKEQLEKIKSSNGQIRILSSTILSPSTNAVINDFISVYPTTKHVVYEPMSYSAIADANEMSFGKRVVPGYNFDKAKVIVGFSCDFLGTWISPVEFTKAYIANRKVTPEKPEMSRHHHFESRLSLTGSNADARTPLKPSDEKLAVVALYNKVASMTGGSTVASVTLSKAAEDAVFKAAGELVAAKGASLVVCGLNDVNCQVLVNGINKMLGSYGTTIDLENASNAGQNNDKAVNDLLADMKNGSVAGLILYHVNPVYSMPNGNEFMDAMKKVGLTVSISDRADETGSNAIYTAPDHHYLESWNDAEPRMGMYSITQPTITHLYQTRQGQDSLLKWSGNANTYETYLHNYWQKNLYGKQNAFSNFNDFWENSVRYGVFETNKGTSGNADFRGNAGAAANNLTAKKSSGMELVLYEKVGLGNGKYANNPWLHEMPDPITKATWDNYVCLPVKYANDNNIKNGDFVKVKSGSNEIELPAIVQPGQPNDTVAIAVGYGRTKCGPAANGLGKNAYPFVMFDGQTFQYTGAPVTVAATGKTEMLAITQVHGSIEGRNIIKETTLEEYKKDPMAGNEERKELKKIEETTLYAGFKYDKLRWNMSIDLNSCIGCGACVVGCNAENNVPVVGRDEVRRVHEMHWMRIDRYYSFTNPKSDKLDDRITKEKEYDRQFSSAFVNDYENVNVTYQPMLCQHCENAPCENVCPVSATNHSSEGLNQMAYNRCVGTRYCANNCPYKVRRFNWFDYTTADSFPWNTAKEDLRLGMVDNMTRMVLNPDVTVRSRGVMEKCSFCVQKIQDGKLQAKKQERPLKDGDIKTACQTACPADAIVFGNVNDSESQIAKLKQNDRTYYVLEDIHTTPSIGYLTKVRNIEEKKSNA